MIIFTIIITMIIMTTTIVMMAVSFEGRGDEGWHQTPVNMCYLQGQSLIAARILWPQWARPFWSLRLWLPIWRLGLWPTFMPSCPKRFYRRMIWSMKIQDHCQDFLKWKLFSTKPPVKRTGTLKVKNYKVWF